MIAPYTSASAQIVHEDPSKVTEKKPIIVIHENPSNLTNVRELDVDRKVAFYVLDMFDYLDAMVLCLNDSDFKGASGYYGDFELSYGDFRALIRHFNLSNIQYGELTEITDLSVADVKMVLTESEKYFATYDLYVKAVSDGDTVKSVQYAMELKKMYDDVTLASGRIEESANTGVLVLENRGYDAYLVYDLLRELRDYRQKLNEKQKLVDMSLINTGLDLASDRNKLIVGENVTYTARLENENKAPVNNSKVRFYFNRIFIGESMTNVSGACSLTYYVPPSIKERRINAYAEFLPQNESLAPCISNVVQLPVEVENTTLSMQASPMSVSYDDTISICGRLISDKGLEVPQRKIKLSIGGEPAGEAVTDENGYYLLKTKVGPYSPAGIVPVNASFDDAGYDDVFRGSSATGSSMEIIPKIAILSINSSGHNFTAGDLMVVQGLMICEDGKPVNDAVIKIYAGNTLLGFTTIEKDGYYSFTSIIPYQVSPGDQAIHSIFSTSSGRAVLPAGSNDIPANFYMIDPVLETDGMPLILFSGDPLAINGTLKNEKGKALEMQSLNVSLSGYGIGNITTDRDGIFSLVHTVNKNTPSGILTIDINAQGRGGLISKGSFQKGQVLVLPYEKSLIIIIPAASLAIISLFIYGPAIFGKGTIRRALYTRKHKKSPISGKREQKAADISLYDFDEDFFNITKSIGIASAKNIMTLIYSAARKLSRQYRMGIPDSVTHREFKKKMAQKVPAVSEPVGSLIDRYEKVCYGRGELGEKDMYGALNSLGEVGKALESGGEEPK